MNNGESLKHTKWECKYHLVFIPKYRKKVLYGALRHQLGGLLRELARQLESQVEEGHLMRDHVHRLMSIPPKYSVAQVGYLKGKSAIHIARTFMGKHRETSRVKASGHEATLSLRWDETSKPFVSTSRNKNRKIDESTS